MKKLSIFLLFSALLGAQTNTALWVRGYSVVPTPQKVELAAGDVQIDNSWTVDPGKVAPRDISVRALIQDAQTFQALSLKTGPAVGKAIRLAITPGTVAVQDPELAKQAYRVKIDAGVIEITGNAAPGLFYGVQTVLQLIKRGDTGRLTVPKGVIADWPKLQLRFLHWDTKHHQDRMETIKRYLDWSARMKANMIGFELEDKFSYPSHPVIGAPGAFTPAQLQEIVNYGLERHIQVVPIIQAPAHLAYVLKHPEFAELRADGNNYQSDLCNPKTYDLIFSMYDDVIKATKGVGYLGVSTDEVYYAGVGGTCKEPYNPENRSLKWVEFVQKANAFAKSRGRRIWVWAEYPLRPEHMKMIPPDVIDGVVGNPAYIPTEKQLRMRQLAYVSTQGEEYLFPTHLAVEAERGIVPGRLEGVQQSLATGRHWQLNPIGSFGAAWSDSGLHNETFWLGWATVAQYSWNPTGAPVEQHAAEFMNLYYGPRVTGMAEIYRNLERQTLAWGNTWDRIVSKERKPGYGNSRGPRVGTERYDLALSAPPLPQLPDLKYAPEFKEKYAKYMETARARSIENDQLAAAIQANFPRADRNRYNLEVLLTLTKFTGHHWRLLTGLARAEDALKRASDAAAKKNAAQAVASMVMAYRTADGLQKEFTRNFEDIKTVWEKAQFPKGRSVDGRNFVHVLDDTKDHWGDRRADLSFMIAPEQSINLEGWLKELGKTLRQYAKDNNVPLAWESEQPWE
jgi:hexosaminidase